METTGRVYKARTACRLRGLELRGFQSGVWDLRLRGILWASGLHGGPRLKETTGGEFRVYRAS